jgi:arylsulfatase A-like enzyme
LSKPNILFLFADDQRFDTISALGNKEIKTPNLDELVKNGTCFTHAHIPGGTVGAVCMPSRAMVNTSRSLFHLQDRGKEIPESDPLIGEELQKWGYETYGIGKWHNGTRAYARSFSDGDEIYFGGMWDHWNVPSHHFDPSGKYEERIPYCMNTFHKNKLEMKITDHITQGKHSTDLFSDTTIKYLKDRYEGKRDNTKPFYLYNAFMAPHDPRTMPKRFLDLYDDVDIKLPGNFLEMHPFEFGIHECRDETLAPYPRTKEDTIQQIKEYYAMISHLDWAIGRIIKTLKETNEYKNTIIIFAGDNGLALGQHGLFGKQNAYEHSLRVPLIFSGPGIKENNISDVPCFLMDIFPTICNLVDIEIPQQVEGLTLFPILKGNKAKTRKVMYFAYESLLRGIQKDKYKLIAYAGAWGRRFQLFDEENDPKEVIDLIAKPEYKNVFDDLKKELEQQRIIQDDNVIEQSITFWKYYSENEK